MVERYRESELYTEPAADEKVVDEVDVSVQVQTERTVIPPTVEHGSADRP
jgi:hypothetical protein